MKYSTYKQLWVWWLPCVALAKDPSPHKTNVGLPIVNGTVVSSPTIFPYQVLITGSNDGGGTLVSSRWVLTAAHIANSNMQLYAGVVNRNNLPSGQLRSYKQHRHHPSYNAPTSAIPCMMSHL
ncbi:MAG: trypsin-like serine protease [Runella sp.]